MSPGIPGRPAVLAGIRSLSAQPVLFRKRAEVAVGVLECDQPGDEVLEYSPELAVAGQFSSAGVVVVRPIHRPGFQSVSWLGRNQLTGLAMKSDLGLSTVPCFSDLCKVAFLADSERQFPYPFLSTMISSPRGQAEAKYCRGILRAPRGHWDCAFVCQGGLRSRRDVDVEPINLEAPVRRGVPRLCRGGTTFLDTLRFPAQSAMFRAFLLTGTRIAGCAGSDIVGAERALVLRESGAGLGRT